MSTENQNQNPNQNQQQNQNQQGTNPQGNINDSQNRPSQPHNESLRSDKQERGLEQNDHTYEGENDVTHAPKRTGEPQSSGASQQGAEKQSHATKAGYAQAEHDKTPEENARNANASDPRESQDPSTGNL